ncbi:MAG: bifunctional phosphoglucose/phosphomannose isomerase [Saprospiraceae bacterium]
MYSLIENFPTQLRQALSQVSNVSILPPEYEIRNICIFGMGGSAIGAKFVKDILKPYCPLPIEIVSGYEVPEYINVHTLVLASSYSGNTEEILSCIRSILSKNAKVVCITSGGSLLKLAEENGLEYVKLPGGSKSPRAFLGVSMVCQLAVLVDLQLAPSSCFEQIRVGADLLSFEQDDIKQKANSIAQALQGKTPMIYTSERMESVAIRWRQQMNENGKILCGHHVIPEMNHNEIVGWEFLQNNTIIILIRNRDDFRRNAQRFDIIKSQLQKKTSSLIEIFSKGQSTIEKMLYLAHLGDWVSYFLAIQNDVDPVEIKMIDYLKDELSKNEVL